jgi:hypothetical protein
VFARLFAAVATPVILFATPSGTFAASVTFRGISDVVARSIGFFDGSAVEWLGRPRIQRIDLGKCLEFVG